MYPSQLVAPCGINCGVCRGHLRAKNPCPGCRANDAGKPITRVRCTMKTCRKSGRGKEKFCFQCDEIPCEALARLDKRYRAKYHMSPIENLRNIKVNGLKKFLEDESVRWACPSCGGTMCVHTGTCIACGRSKITW